LQLAERVDAVSHSVSSERNRREVAKQNTEQQIQGLRDMLAADRSTRRSELVGFNSMLEEMRQALLDEPRGREAIEARHTSDVNWLSERIEALARSQAEKVQDLCEQVKTVALNVHSSLQDGTRSVLQVQSIAESTQIEASARLKKLEDHFPLIESRIGEIANREVAHYDELQIKQRKLFVGLEDLRLEERSKGVVMRRLQAGENEEMRQAELLANLSTTMLSEVEAPTQLATSASGIAAVASGFSPIPSSDNVGASCRYRSASVGPRGAMARSPSPPMPLAPASFTSTQGYGTPSSPAMRMSSYVTPITPGSVQVPQGSLPATYRQSIGAPATGSTAEAVALSMGSVPGRSVMGPPQAYRLPPRSLSPVMGRRTMAPQQQQQMMAPQQQQQMMAPQQQQQGWLSAPRQTTV